jgi:hypothetical protein
MQSGCMPPTWLAGRLVGVPQAIGAVQGISDVNTILTCPIMLSFSWLAPAAMKRTSAVIRDPRTDASLDTPVPLHHFCKTAA